MACISTGLVGFMLAWSLIVFVFFKSNLDMWKKNYSSVSDMNIVDLARRGMCLHMGTVGLMFGHGLGGVNKM